MKAQLSAEALLAVMAFVTFMTLLITASSQSGGKIVDAARMVRAHAAADALALELNFRSVDAARTSLLHLTAPEGCDFMRVAGEVGCNEGNQSGFATIYGGTTGYEGYVGYNRLPV
jgi:hypothetical protein